MTDPPTDIAVRTVQGRAGLAAFVSAPESALVALDFDGTLVPIVDDPRMARAAPGVVAVLSALARRVQRVAIITGRPAATAVEYAGLRGHTGLGRLVVLGQYGLERWEAQTEAVTAPTPAPGVAEARRRLPDLLAAHRAADAYVEDKGTALAVHTRRLADPEGAFARLRDPLQELADRVGLVLEPGRFVLELRPAGVDKGGALRALADEEGVRTVLFAGDDLGDLAAFDTVDGLRAEGVAGLLVCSASAEETALAEHADVVVDGPEGVVVLLRALVDLLERGAG
ncbi:MAG: trehalose-phosphatase [Nocardioidaceae bacterium]